MKKGKPTKPNKTGKATASDFVMTPHHIAKKVIQHFKPGGFVLEPARGGGSFYDQLPNPKDWCEIIDGRDFLEYKKKVEWIITNPPYSIYDIFLKKCFEVADNVVLLVPIAKAFKSISTQKLVDDYGGLKEIWLFGGGGVVGFSFGFPVGCLYYKRGYRGDIKYTSGLF